MFSGRSSDFCVKKPTTDLASHRRRYRRRRIRVSFRDEGVDQAIWVQGWHVLRRRSILLISLARRIPRLIRLAGRCLCHHWRDQHSVYRPPCSRTQPWAIGPSTPAVESLDDHQEDPPRQGHHQARLFATIDILRVCRQQRFEFNGQFFAGRLHSM